jgi:hypothetical protein
MNRADRTGDGTRRTSVGFALQILQRRLRSSPAAIHRSLERRLKRLRPGSFADPLTEVLRNGARALLAQAIEAEVAEFLAKHVDLKTATGLSHVVRHGPGNGEGLRPVVGLARQQRFARCQSCAIHRTG